MNRYRGNVLTLAALDGKLAADVEIAAVAEHVVPLAAKSGAATAQIVRGDGRRITLHSRYDPVKGAEAFAAAADTEKITTYIVLGFGLGYHIKALLAASRKESQIIVIEKDLSVFRAAMEAVDLREVFASQRVFPIVGKAMPDIFAALNPHVVKIFLDTTYLVHRPSVETDPDYYNEVHRSLGDYITYGMQNVVTTVSVDFLSKMNTLMNLPWYAASPGVGRWRGAYEGHPAIVVSAGPSLHRNVEVLARAQGKAVIIAVSTVFKPLLRRGIKPDFAVVLDYHPISRKYFDDAAGDRDVVLVVDPKASWEAVEAHRGPKAVIGNHALDNIIGGPSFEKGVLPAGTTVAHSAFYFAQYIGAEPIIFVGQDLAHPDGVTHFPGTAVHDLWAVESNRFESIERREWETLLRMRNALRKIKDIHGNDIYTDGQMFSYLQQFEMNFYNSKATIIDATEGGAAKKYTTVMTLEEALGAYTTRPLPEMAGAVAPETPDIADEAGLDKIENVLKERLSAISKVRDFYERTLSTLREVEELWPDQEAMRPLFVRVEGIRVEVKRYREVGKLVKEIAQGLELLKVRADRKILSDRLEGIEEQKARLDRDIEYIGGLRHAVDALEGLFTQALERFEAFDFDRRIPRLEADE